jgi:hypothetical protein
MSSEFVGEAVLRFLLGGAVVSLFAVAATIFKPPTFAGIFGSAPSVEIATLTLAFARQGPDYAATEAQSMIIGAAGLVAYSAACVWGVERPHIPVWAGTALCWATWMATTLVLWTVIRGAT